MLTFFELAKPSNTVIKVIGVGGAGNNAVRRMEQAGISGVEFIGIDTSVRNLITDNKVHIGEKITGGRGTGALPEIGEMAARENLEAIENVLRGADMSIITCGMGGGTGTGAAPIVAEISKEMGILTVGIVTRPFYFEGRVRSRNAESGIERLIQVVDTLIIVSNDNLLKTINSNITVSDAFKMGDEVLRQSVQGITNIISDTYTVNVDFADIRAVMLNKGLAHIGMGTASGEDKAIAAIKAAVNNPLIETDITNATDLIINMTGDLSMIEINEAITYVTGKTGNDINVIFGCNYDESMQDTCNITIIATGMGDYY